MTLHFLGTRGYIERRSRRHRRHAALLIVHRGRRVLVDCGEDWRGRLAGARPEAIVVTHAHPDHAGGLAAGSPCPVHASAAAWRGMRRFPIAAPDRRRLAARRPVAIAGITFEAFPVEHSALAPAVGYRISAGGACLFYVPDLAALPDAARALRGVQLYVGDGAALARPILRRRDGRLIGHTTIATQLGWCARAGVPRAVFTHCGTAIVGADPARVAARVRALGRALGLRARLAHDGLVLHLRTTTRRRGLRSCRATRRVRRSRGASRGRTRW